MDLFNNFLALFSHEYFLLLYGLFLWHLVRWLKAGNKTEGTNVKFSHKQWWKDEFNEIVVALAFAPLLIVFDDELLEIYNDTVETDIIAIQKWMYLLSGVAIDRLIGLFFKSQ